MGMRRMQFYDHEQDKAVWTYVDNTKITLCEKTWLIEIPMTAVLDAGSASELESIITKHHTIYNLGINPEGELASEEGIAEQLTAQQKETWHSLLLTDKEIVIWEEEIEKMELPLRIAYTRGYTNMVENAHWLNMMLVFFVIIILCDSFSKDRQLEGSITFSPNTMFPQLSRIRMLTKFSIIF